jgi:hypothetical protein
MNTRPIITWHAPAHVYTEKTNDWYWSVGIITLAIAVVCFIFGQIIPGIFVIVGSISLVLVSSKPPKRVKCEINDRGIMLGRTLYPFVTLDSFWMPHDHIPPKLLVKSRRPLMPLIVIMIDEVDPEDVRDVMVKYIAEKEIHEPFLVHVLEGFGF